MNASSNTLRDRVAARDGTACWLCAGELNFLAPPNSKKAPTLEHLEPKSLGGPRSLDNLVLCHPGCNKQLADRPRADKERMRRKRQANAAKVAAKAPAKAPPPAPSGAPALPASAPKSARPTSLERAGVMPPQAVVATQAMLVIWQRLALGSTGAALFLAGLVAGLLIS